MLENAADVPRATASDSVVTRSPARAPAPSPAKEAQRAEPALNSQQVRRSRAPPCCGRSSGPLELES